jgi:hypothetical protein
MAQAAPPLHGHKYPDDKNMDCLIGGAEVLAGKKARPSNDHVQDLIIACKRADPSWLFCTPEDYYCEKYAVEVLNPYLRSIVAPTGPRTHDR